MSRLKQLIAIWGLLCALSTEVAAQTVFCPTRPPGTNDNTCASTAFVIANGGGGGGTPGGATTQVQFNNAGAFGGSANLTWVSPKLTLGTAGSTAGLIGFNNATSGQITLRAVTGALGTVTVSLPAATDTLVGKATTDTFTNKTFDTAGTGNAFAIGGQSVTAVSGNTSTVASVDGALVSGECVESDASGNLVTSGVVCGGGSGSPGGANTQVQFNSAGNFGGSANLTWVSPALTVGAAGVTGRINIAGLTSGTTGLVATAVAGSTTLTLPAATDTLVGKATTDTLTNKTFDTAGTGNAFAIGGQSITQVSGNTNKVATFTGAETSGDCVSIDGSGNLVAAGGACTTGGGGGTVASSTIGQVAVYTAATTVTGLGTPLSVAVGGTGRATLTQHSILVGDGTNAVTLMAGNQDGTIVVGDTAAGPHYSAQPVLGVTSALTGSVRFRGITSGLITLTAQAAAGTWTLTLPTSAGTSGQVLQTNGSGVTTWATATGDVTGPASSQRGGTPTWSGTTGKVVVDGKGAINVLAYGADPTGVADSTSAITTAWAAGPIIYLPQGKYLVTSTITAPSVSGAGIIGDGAWHGTNFTGGSWTSAQGGTLIVATHTTTDVIRFPASSLHSIVKGIAIMRTSQATAGYGLNMNITTNTNDQVRLQDIHVANHNVGIRMGSTGWSTAQDIMSQGNRSHGVEVFGQWQLLNIFSALNGGDGFHVEPSTHVSMGQWRGLSTFNNTGSGISFVGSAGSRIEGIRLSDSFFGDDGGACVAMSTFHSASGPHVLTNVYTENCDSGFITFNQTGSLSCVNCVALNHTGFGWYTEATGFTSITGGMFNLNGNRGFLGGAGTFVIMGLQALFNSAPQIRNNDALAITICGTSTGSSIDTAGSSNVFTACGNF